jgi:hypothetical protein
VEKDTIVLLVIYLIIFVVGIITLTTSPSEAKSPKSKFYDFSEQLIDGEIKKPTALYTDARTQVKFERLLKLKKSFIPALLDTSKDPVFK